MKQATRHGCHKQMSSCLQDQAQSNCYWEILEFWQKKCPENANLIDISVRTKMVAANSLGVTDVALNALFQVFLKKHKCASSTIYDILNRYKKKHKLFAASKPIGSFVGGYPNFFNSTFVAPPQADKYDIIFNHFRWNENEIKKVTFDDTVFLTSVR